MIKALKPLIVLRTSHGNDGIAQWRALKLSTTELERYNGDPKSEKMWRKSSIER